jgi:hypothetical protein
MEERKMNKKFLVLTLMTLALAGSLFATTFVGGGVSKEFSGYFQRTFIDGRVTVENMLAGNMLTLDVEGELDPSNFNPTIWAQLYTYINFNLPISNFEIYVGFSPSFFFGNGVFNTEEFQQHGYVHGGVAVNLQKVRIYGELFKQLVYSPFGLGNVIMGSVGAQFGF